MSAAAYPVRVDATLEPGLSRWLWLVKWFLAIPHYIVLIFLWVAFVTVGVIAFFAILFTRRYPRSLFEFNVGVLRWTWRVSYYTYGALGTDRYPPFTLADVADYPAHFDVAYPGRLSRGLVLVKWWLLAIPHYLVVGIFVGGTWITWQYADQLGGVGGGGLIGLLVLIAAVVLAVTGRYPQQIFDFVLGMNRWALRVAAYAGLMTDEYPPFRLDMGGSESPAGTLTLPAPVEQSDSLPRSAPPSPPRRSGWTGLRVVSLVVGCLLGLVSLGLLAGGGAATWATTTQRDSAGYLTTDTHDIVTSTYAVTSEDIDFVDWTGPITPADVLGDVRVRATAIDPKQSVFIGVGPKASVDRYLAGARHKVVTSWWPFHTDNRLSIGAARPGAPTQAPIWSAQVSGRDTQTLTWRPHSGNWVVVVMNADGKPGIAVTADVGLTAPDLKWVAVGLFIAGGLLLGAAVLFVALPISRASSTTG